MKTIPVRHIKRAIKEPDLLSDLLIWNLSSLLSGQDMWQELHRHSFYFLLVIKEGSGEHIIDFTSYPIADESVYIMRPGQVHELRLGADSEGYLLQFTNEHFPALNIIAKQILEKVSRKNYYPPGSVAFDEIFALMQAIYREAEEKKERHDYAIQINLELFFLALLRQSGTKATSDKNYSYREERLDLFRDLIAEHIFTHKEVQWYAAKMNITTYQLNTITKAILGKSSSVLINDYILLEAKRYLLATSNQINQISWHLGYEDVSYFVRFFRKHTGYTPEAFRNHFK